MNVHKNARLTPIGRERIVFQVLGGQTPQAVSQAAGEDCLRCPDCGDMGVQALF